MSNSRGIHKVEFYMALDEIKELYNQGYVVFKILYEEMKKRRKWEMSYWSFCKYAKQELLDNTKSKAHLNNENITHEIEDLTPKNEVNNTDLNEGPIIPPSIANKGFNYNPNTTEIDPRKTI